MTCAMEDLRRRRLLLAGLAEFGGQCRDPSLELRIGGRRPAGSSFRPTAAPEWRLIGERLSLVDCSRCGRRIVNSVNSPNILSTSIVPPCCWVTMS